MGAFLLSAGLILVLNGFTKGCTMILHDLYGVMCISYGLKLTLHWFYLICHVFMLIRMHVNMSIFDVFMSLVCPTSVPQDFVSAGKCTPGLVDCVNFGNCSICKTISICGSWDLFKKDACRTIVNFGGTKASGSPMVSQLVNK
jgi:hypothetical protein